MSCSKPNAGSSRSAPQTSSSAGPSTSKVTSPQREGTRATFSANRAEIASASCSSDWLMLLQRAMVCVRWIFFCSCIRPYSRASAVGGQPGT